MLSVRCADHKGDPGELGSSFYIRHVKNYPPFKYPFIYKIFCNNLIRHISLFFLKAKLKPYLTVLRHETCCYYGACILRTIPYGRGGSAYLWESGYANRAAI